MKQRAPENNLAQDSREETKGAQLQLEQLAKDRQGWKDFVAALCATQAWWVVSK